MTNGKKTNKTKETEQIGDKRQTVVTKGISRKIQTAQFFSLEISHIAQDTIEWASLEERESKINNLTKIAIKDFIQTHDNVLDKLKLGQQYAFVKDAIKENAKKKTMSVLDIEDFEEL